MCSKVSEPMKLQRKTRIEVIDLKNPYGVNRDNENLHRFYLLINNYYNYAGSIIFGIYALGLIKITEN